MDNKRDKVASAEISYLFYFIIAAGSKEIVSISDNCGPAPDGNSYLF
jgi:hypothetical protein